MTQTTKHIFTILLVFIVNQVFANPVNNTSLSWSNLNSQQYLEKRLSCQTQIEDFQWAQNTWPKENHTLKPARKDVISNYSILVKVNKSIQMEKALYELSGITITQKMLQGDIDRMSRSTKQPKKLKNLFKMLNNNSTAIAECISRPHLVEDKLRNFYQTSNDLDLKELSFDKWWENSKDTWSSNIIRVTGQYKFPNISDNKTNFDVSPSAILGDTWKHRNRPTGRLNHSAIWTGSEMIIWGGITYGGLTISGFRYNPITDNWSQISSIGAPSPREEHRAFWTGTKMIIWGGNYSISNSNGWIYDPSKNTWSELTTENIISGRYKPSTIWTGSEIIIWGGAEHTVVVNTGKKYNPESNTWSDLSQNGAPEPSRNHHAVWTGEEMIVWGGINEETGGRYNPETDTWQSMSHINSTENKEFYTATWANSIMIIWGGIDENGNLLNIGSSYNPETDTWSPISSNGAPSARKDHIAIWTGEEMIIWGGKDDEGNFLKTGSRYNPETDSWTMIEIADLQFSDRDYSVLWTGDEMIVWGGVLNSTLVKTGVRYNPNNNTWKQIEEQNEPVARFGHTAFWTGSEMLIWGGRSNVNLYDGSLYNPLTDTWRPIISQSEIEENLSFDTKIWTGLEMLLWGGRTYDVNTRKFVYHNKGIKYNPFTDEWSEIINENMPSARALHSSIWTGSEMIIWGGFDGEYLNTGYKYNPVSNTWSQMSNTDAPSARKFHTSIWTGKEMIVWKGRDENSEFLTSGSLYNPLTDSWREMNEFGTDPMREGYSVIWSGKEMIVWSGTYLGFDFNSGGRFDPETNTWAEMSKINATNVGSGHTAIWTGRDMIVWGGAWGEESIASREGGIYSPDTDSWKKIARGPTARYSHSSVWTGQEMIIWGGVNVETRDVVNVTVLSDMGIYYPYYIGDGFVLNDTGVTWSGDDPVGNGLDCDSNIFSPQDCNTGRDVSENDDSDGHAGFSFTKLDSQGLELPVTATDWSCTKDNVTGIIWENKTNSGLHSKNDLFSWYNTNPDLNGGDEGEDNANINTCYGYNSGNPITYCNSESFVNRVNSESLCGASDWVIPNVKELSSIVDYSVFKPSIDNEFFPNTKNSNYLSSNTRVYIFNDELFSENAWNINFRTGHDSIIKKYKNSYIRLMRREK